MSYVTIDGIDYNETFNQIIRLHYNIKQLPDGHSSDWICAHEFEQKIDYANVVNQGYQVVNHRRETKLFNETYVDTIHNNIPHIFDYFKCDRNTRRAVIRFPGTTCLTTIQFQIRNDELRVTATYRSLLHDNVPVDYSLIKELGLSVASMLDCELETLTMFAANYHFLR